MNRPGISVESMILLHARAQKALRNSLKPILKHYGLTYDEWLTLLVIEKSDRAGVTMTELAETLGLPASRVSLLVTVLQNIQHVRLKEAQDKRYKKIYVHARGRIVLDKIRELLNKNFYNEDEVQASVDLINRLLKAIGQTNAV